MSFKRMMDKKSQDMLRKQRRNANIERHRKNMLVDEDYVWKDIGSYVNALIGDVVKEASENKD